MTLSEESLQRIERTLRNVGFRASAEGVWSRDGEEVGTFADAICAGLVGQAKSWWQSKRFVAALTAFGTGAAVALPELYQAAKALPEPYGAMVLPVVTALTAGGVAAYKASQEQRKP